MQELESAGDKGKRKRSNWYKSTNNNLSNSHISIEGHDTMMGGNGGTGIQQPPASPIDADDSPVASSSEPPPKKSSTGEWSALAVRDGSTGELIEDHVSLLTGGSADSAWEIGGGPTATGRGLERMEEGMQVNSDGDGGERMYDGNFVANMSPFMSVQLEPEEMGFKMIGDEDEDMRDAQHVEFLDGNGEQGGAGDAAWRVFMDGKSK